MTYDPNKHHRRSIRLRNYDYASTGMYFVTICVQNRELLFGRIVEGTLQLNAAGQIVQTVWTSLPERFPHIEIDEFVVMPNHFHGILIIHQGDANDGKNKIVGVDIRGAPTADESVGTPLALVDTPNRAGLVPAPTNNYSTLGNMIGAFKSITTHQYIQGVRQKGWPSFDGRLWQRNYWEHIIRNDESLNKIRQYIQTNPVSWVEDKLHPNAPPFVS